MKKLLILSTTMLLPVLAQAAEAPKVKLGGRMDTIAASIKGKKEFRNTNPANPTAATELNNFVIVNDTKLDVNVDGKSPEYDFKYGGMIRLNSDASTASSSETSFGDKTMVYLEHNKIGRLEAGNTPGAGALLEMGTSFLNTGSWGVEGFSMLFIEDKTMRYAELHEPLTLYGQPVEDTRALEFIETPNLPSNYSGHYYSDAPKVNFFTKPVSFVTLGITYIPDMDSTGTVKGMALKNGSATYDSSRINNPATFRNIVSGGIQFDKEVSKGIELKLSLAGEAGKAKSHLLHDLKAYETGFMVTYNKNTRLTATYGNWMKTGALRNPVAGAKQRADYWTAGVGQQIDKLGLAVTYMNSKKAGGIESLTTTGLINYVPTQESYADYSTNNFNNIVFDIDYELAPGFKPYAGVSFYSFRESTGAKDNGSVVMIGNRLVF
ncbi:MAG: porin [Rickettsiales bacterium]